MPEQKKLSAEEAHRYFAVETNNRTWDLIEKVDRTLEEDVQMIHQVHASCYHWAQVGEPVNQVRGHYMVAKVYFALGMAESAYYWAEKTWNQTVELQLASWDYAFACEIMARAHASKGDKAAFEELHGKAVTAIEGLGEEDAALCRAELDRAPWFGWK